MRGVTEEMLVGGVFVGMLVKGRWFADFGEGCA